MIRYETPPAIASVLARHAPRNMRRILDPAVGFGALLEPFMCRKSNKILDIFAVDIDSKAINCTGQKFRSFGKGNITAINANFLDWAPNYLNRPEPEYFDCVVMNPPFASRPQKWRSFECLKELSTFGGIPNSGPIEAGFVIASLALLRPGGRLLAILPGSLMASPKLKWVRELLMFGGAVKFVHELPRFAFPKIEGRIYMVVFEKGLNQANTLLLNHDLVDPERMSVGRNELDATKRLDFGYYFSAARVNKLRLDPSFGWKPLHVLAVLVRGKEHSPNRSENTIHTGNYKNGFWTCGGSEGRMDAMAGINFVKESDILVKRVSRECSRTFGVAFGSDGRSFSDCVICVRPKSAIDHFKLLFSLRTLMTFEFSKCMLEKGTGASYLSQKELNELQVPYGLSDKFEGFFGQYVKAVKSMRFDLMVEIESIVAARILKESSSGK